MEGVPYYRSRASIKLKGHTDWKIDLYLSGDSKDGRSYKIHQIYLVCVFLVSSVVGVTQKK